MFEISSLQGKLAIFSYCYGLLFYHIQKGILIKMPDTDSCGLCRRSDPTQLCHCFPDTIVLQVILRATAVSFALLLCCRALFLHFVFHYWAHSRKGEQTFAMCILHTGWQPSGGSDNAVLEPSLWHTNREGGQKASCFGALHKMLTLHSQVQLQ